MEPPYPLYFPRMDKQAMDTSPAGLRAAVKRFRKSFGDSQQSFSQRLGVSMSAVVRYERTRAPRGKALALLARLALATGNGEAAAIFTEALRVEFGWRLDP